MAGPVEICNVALGWLGVERITSFDDASRPAQLCADNYPAAVRSVLEERAWTFATVRREATAPQQSGVPELPWRWPLPTDVVRLLRCSDGLGSYTLDWRLESGAILTAHTARLLYQAVVLVEDPALFSPGFTRAVTARLAADLAVPISENSQLAQVYEVKYERELTKAGTLDGLQGKSQIRGGHTLAGVR